MTETNATTYRRNHPDLPTIQQKYSLQPHTADSSGILVSQKNWTNTDPQNDYRPRSPSTNSQNKPESSASLPAAVQEVQPLLGTTLDQRQQLQLVTATRHPRHLRNRNTSRICRNPP